MEIEAHEGHITDIMCVSYANDKYTGDVFFTSSFDCKKSLKKTLNLDKIKAWKIDGDQLVMMGELVCPNNSAVTCLGNNGADIVFGGCQDGGVIAWNVMEDCNDVMKTDGSKVSNLA